MLLNAAEEISSARMQDFICECRLLVDALLQRCFSPLELCVMPLRLAPIKMSAKVVAK